MNNWKVVGAITEDKLLEDVKSSRKFIIYFALINIILPSLLIILITRNIHHRLSNVLKHMRKLEAQSFEIIEGKEYKDEIGALTSGFNRMSLKIKGLINDVYVASIQKKDLDLQRKQAQARLSAVVSPPCFVAMTWSGSCGSQETSSGRRQYSQQPPARSRTRRARSSSGVARSSRSASFLSRSVRLTLGRFSRRDNATA